jgi:uncharacterized protein with PIN domain
MIDGMLGKLARWLRMLGYNVKYSNNLDDDELIKIAKMEKRILLTRDLELYQRALSQNVKAFYVEGKQEAERLANLARRFKLKLEIDVSTSRCPKCNTKIKSIEKDKVKGKVPENTFLKYNEFWQCPKCGQIYWQGAHWTRINKTLLEARKN